MKLRNKGGFIFYNLRDKELYDVFYVKTNFANKKKPSLNMEKNKVHFVIIDRKGVDYVGTPVAYKDFEEFLADEKKIYDYSDYNSGAQLYDNLLPTKLKKHYTKAWFEKRYASAIHLIEHSM
jgi:hypothetical protein